MFIYHQAKNDAMFKNYYESVIVPLPPNCKNKQVKMELQTGEWKRFSNVNTTKKLNRLLLKHSPKNVYYSDASWANTRRLEHPSFQAQRIPIGSELTVDVDANDFGNSMLNAKIEAARIFHFLKEEHSEIQFSRAKSTGGGYHLTYEIILPEIPYPEARLEYVSAVRNSIADSLTLFGFTYDKVLRNPFQVYRMEWTLNGNRMIVCAPTTSPDKWTIRGILTEMTPTPPGVTPKKASLIQSAEKSRFADKASHAKPGRGPGLYCYKFFDARLNKDHFTPHLVFRKRKGVLDRIRRVAEAYGHGFAVFETEMRTYALSPRIVSHRRYLKMLRSSNAASLRSFEKTGHSKVQTSGVFHEKTVFDGPKFVGLIGEPRRGTFGKTALSFINKHADFAAEAMDKWNQKLKICVVRHHGN